MKKTLDANTELLSLNEELHTEFTIQELEQRLETDPLMFVDFFQQSLQEGSPCTPDNALIVCNDVLNYCSNPEALISRSVL